MVNKELLNTKITIFLKALLIGYSHYLVLNLNEDFRAVISMCKVCGVEMTTLLTLMTDITYIVTRQIFGLDTILIGVTDTVCLAVFVGVTHPCSECL